MHNFTFKQDNVNITIEADTLDDVFFGLKRLGVDHLINSDYYFSKTELNKTGNGWLKIDDMNDNFVVNAILAKVGDLARQLLADGNSSEIYQFFDLIQSLNDDLLFTFDDVHGFKHNHDIIYYLIQNLINRPSIFDND